MGGPLELRMPGKEYVNFGGLGGGSFLQEVCLGLGHGLEGS